MKKPIKITLLILSVITVIAVIAASVMLKAVSGDSLFYMDSALGNLYAVSYRWVCLTGAILVLFWLLLVIKTRKAIAAKLLKLKRGEKNAAGMDTLPVTSAAAVSTAPAETPSKVTSAVLCTNCGKQIPINNKFCPFCGEPVRGYASGEENNA
jgi:hypothetical protein